MESSRMCKDTLALALRARRGKLKHASTLYGLALATLDEAG
jgi:hypothetical protein